MHLSERRLSLMLEKYFVRPDTVDRFRASWIGADIERYVEWLDAQGYSWKSIVRYHPALRSSLLGRGEPAIFDHARLQPLRDHSPGGERAELAEDVGMVNPVKRRRQ